MYYIYAHREADSSRVFYVGKGSGKRAWKSCGRSAFWQRIKSKHGIVVEILESNLSEGEAFLREIYWIAHYKTIGQCRANISLGGDGVNVTVRWWGNAISKGLKERFNTMPPPRGKRHPSFKPFASASALQKDYAALGLIAMAAKYGVTPPTIAARLRDAGIAVRTPGRQKTAVLCTTDSRTFPCLAEAARFYGIHRENISKVLKGKYKHTGGKHFRHL